jgi:hypothetical protein
MHAVISIMMAVLLGVHALFGCCRYPGHSCKQYRCNQCSQSAHDAHSQCCQQPGQGISHQERHQCPHRDRVECHGVCVYLPSQEMQMDCSQGAVPIDQFAILATSTDALYVGFSQWTISHGRLNSKLPLRLHLWHQILLI